MSKTTENPDKVILSGSRAIGGISEETSAIPAVHPTTERRSDSSGEVSDHSPIAPPARSSRRGFLMNSMVSAASLATATAVAGPPEASAASATESPGSPHLIADPILAAINAHKSAVEAYMNAVGNHCRLEEGLPADRRKSNIDAWERKIVETDDPSWIEAEEQVDKTSDAMTDAAEEILNLEPTTLQGAAAVLQYAVDHMDHYDGEMMGWPDDLVPDGVDPDATNWSTRSAEYFLMQSVAAWLRLQFATS